MSHTMFEPFSTFLDGRSMTLDVVVEEGETIEQVATWLTSTPAATGKITWRVVGPAAGAGGWPIVRFDAVESIDDRTARNALFGIYQRYNGVNVGLNVGKPPVGKGQRRLGDL